MAGPDRKLPQPPRSYLSRGPLAADSHFPGCPSWGGAAASNPINHRPWGLQPPLPWPGPRALNKTICLGRDRAACAEVAAPKPEGQHQWPPCPQPRAGWWTEHVPHPLGETGSGWLQPHPHGPPLRGPEADPVDLQACFCPSPRLEGAWEPVRAQEGAAASPVGLTGQA